MAGTSRPPLHSRPRAAPFDHLVEALQSEVARAQKSIDARHQGRLQKLLDLDGSGNTEALSYVLQVKVPGPGGDRALRVPLLTLRPHIQHKLVSVSLDLKTVFEETPSAEPDAPPVLAAVVGGKSWRHPLHRLRVALFGPQPGAGEISLDGRPLRRLPAAGKP